MALRVLLFALLCAVAFAGRGRPITTDGIHWVSYSQKGQDVFVLKALNYMREGFYVDLACAEPFTDSNSAALETSFGWRGICIDGNNDTLKKWVGKRKCTVVNAILDEFEGEKREFIKNAGLGGIIGEDVDNSFRHRRARIEDARRHNKTYLGKTTTLARVLEDHSAPRIINYFSFDIEGAETRVLRSGVLREYVFQVISIERPSLEAHHILEEHGYTHIKSVGWAGRESGFTESYYFHESIVNDAAPRVGGARSRPAEMYPKKT